MTGPEAAARTVLTDACKRLDRLGLVHATAGNASVRLGPVVLISPAGAPLGTLSPEDLVRITLDGESPDGRRPSSELRLHLALYGLPAVGAVVHTHSPYATALSFQERPLPLQTEEARMVLGEVPTLPLRPAGSRELAQAVAEAAARVGAGDEFPLKAVLLAEHGVVAWASDLQGAVAVAELVEATAMLAYIRETWRDAGGLSRRGPRRSQRESSPSHRNR